MQQKIEKCFAHLIGQEKPIKNRVRGWTAYALGDNPPNGFFTGEAGLGKSALMRADYQAAQIAIAERGEAIECRYYASASELRKQGEEWKIFLGEMLSPSPVFYWLDEAHELLGKPVLVQGAKVAQIIKGLCDSTRGTVRNVSFGDEGTITRHASQICFVLGTNFPAQIVDNQAIVSRLGVVALEAYSEIQLAQIAAIMAEEMKLTIHESHLATIGRCGRGTARPIEKILGEAARVARIENKHSLNKGEIIELIRDCELYPCGLTKKEVALLARSIVPQSRAGLAIALGWSSKEATDSLAFLSNKGFISSHAGKVTLTKLGADFMSALKSEKFEIPGLA